MANNIPTAGGFLRRPRIDELLERGTAYPIVTVVAPPGYGKTQAVAAYAADAPMKVVWMDIPSHDNDPGRFWVGFVGSLRKEFPELAEKLSEMDFPSSPGSFDTFLKLFTFFTGSPGERRLLLVADDYCNVSDRWMAEFFERLTESDIGGLCLTLICSSRINIGLNRVAKVSEPYSIGVEDLRFTESEARAFFLMEGLDIPPAELRRIVANSEGWPLAIYLVRSRYIGGRKSIGDGESLFTHISYIHELFESEYFAGYDRFVREALLKLAKLPCFPLEVAAKLNRDRISEISSALSSNVFVSQNYSTGLMRFHNVYHKFLLHKGFLVSDEEEKKVFLTAGEWFHENEMWREAVDCYLKCCEYERVLDVLIDMPKVNISASLGEHLLSQLMRIPEDYRKQSPLARFAIAFFHLNAMEVGKAQEMLLSIRDELDAENGGGALLGETYAMLANVDLIHNEDSFADNFKRAYELLPEGSRIQSRWIAAENNNSVFFLPGKERGMLEHVLESIFEIAPCAERILNRSGYGFEWLFAAEAAYYSYDMKKARENSFRAIYKAAEKGQYDIVCNAYYVLIRLAVFYGDYRDAAGHIASMERYIEEGNLTYLHELWDCTTSWFYIKMRDLQKVPRWLSECVVKPYASSPLSVGRDRIVHAFYLMAKRDYVEALAALGHMEGMFSQKGLWSVRLTLYIMKSVCYLRLGKKNEALDAFRAAYDMSHENGIITPFVEFGNAMRTMIDNARKTNRYEFSPAWLGDVYRKSTSYAKRLATIMNDYNRANRIKPVSGVMLTGREKEVLGYLAQGMTREEIGGFLGISVNSVKKCVSAIYDKLGAVNRADAVRIATMSGLING